MSTSQDEQSQAMRLLALAVAARERGDTEEADQLMTLALGHMGVAGAPKLRSSPPGGDQAD